MGEESLVKSMQSRPCVQFCVTSRCHQAAERNIVACEVLWSWLNWQWLPTRKRSPSANCAHPASAIVLIYCRDHRCLHHVEEADGRADDTDARMGTG